MGAREMSNRNMCETAEYQIEVPCRNEASTMRDSRRELNQKSAICITHTCIHCLGSLRYSYILYSICACHPSVLKRVMSTGI